jgi:hypothetical protein
MNSLGCSKSFLRALLKVSEFGARSSYQTRTISGLGVMPSAMCFGVISYHMCEKREGERDTQNKTHNFFSCLFLLGIMKRMTCIKQFKDSPERERD